MREFQLPPPYLISLEQLAGEPQIGFFERNSDMDPLLNNAYHREIYIRTAAKSDSLPPKNKTPEEHSEALMRLAPRLDRAERADNGTRIAMYNNPNPYGEIAYDAYHNPLLVDHNFDHDRRVELYDKRFIRYIPEFRHIPYVTEFIDAAARFPASHDRDQVLTQQRNIDEGTKLPPKHGHVLAGAVMILAETEEYARARGISIEQAREDSHIAAVMVLYHDRQSQITRTGEEVKAYNLNDQELYSAYKENRLDLKSISSAQLIELLRIEKSKINGFITDATPNGLHPAFETAYAEKLEELRDNKKEINTRPLFENSATEEGKAKQKALEAWIDFWNLSDKLDMISPPEESIFRKLRVPKALDRPFYRPDVYQAAFLEQVKVAEASKDFDSDVRRFIWEVTHSFEDFGEVITESPAAQQLIKETVIKGALAFDKTGTKLMRGDFSDVDRVYERNINELGAKYLRQAGVSEERLKEKLLESPETPYEDVVLGLLKPTESIHKELTPHEAFLQKIDTLYMEKVYLIEHSLKPKFLKDGDLHYSESDIKDFQHDVGRVLNILYDQYDVTPRERIEYEDELKAGVSQFEFFQSYYSTHRGEPRTIFELKS